MVGPKIPRCNCDCAPPVNFEWGRPTRIVGAQSPHASMSAYTQPWQDMSADSGYLNTQLGFKRPGGYPSTDDFYMQPMRYEIGKPNTTLNPAATIKVGSHQLNVAVSTKSPPLNGHLDSTTVGSIDIMCEIYRTRTTDGSGMSVFLTGIEAFRNGVSLGLQTISGMQMTANYGTVSGGFFSSGVSARYRYNLSSSLNVVESDTWQWDVYVHVKKPPSTSSSYSWMVFASNGSGVFSDVYARYLSTTTLIGTSAANALKFVFGSNGPDGITELTMVTQTGWLRLDTGNTSFEMYRQDVPSKYVISFDWGREIPYVGIYSEVFVNNPATPFISADMRYLPADSGDYSSHYVTSILNETYGFWSPAGSTVFSNMRRTQSYGPPYFYTTPGGYYDPGFPSSITVEPA